MTKEVAKTMYAITPAALPPVGPPSLAADPVTLAPQLGAAAGLPAGAATALTVRSSTLNVLEGHAATVAGELRMRHPLHAVAGRVVVLQALLRGGWRTLARSRTSASGAFRLRYTPQRTGSERVRLRFAGDQTALGARHALGRLNVYRQVEASWYGGGGSLACGGSLSSTTMGVASRTLPCGSVVTLRFAGRSVRVPVIDRGPYVEGRELDLTEATKQVLGFGDTGSLWSTA
jgi:rare lipoprotein A